jgi:hypothetical protein
VTPDPPVPASADLHLPAEPSPFATVRAFVGAFVAKHADDEQAADMQLAVQEACAELLGSTLTVRLEIGEHRIGVRCEGVAPPAATDAGELRLRLLEALAPDAEWVRGDSVRFTMPRSA